MDKTADELSLLCPSAAVPAGAFAREDGWKGFYITGTLDFSLVGILSKITALLAEKQIAVYAVSTYHTDYFFVKREQFAKTLQTLYKAGYAILPAKAEA